MSKSPPPPSAISHRYLPLTKLPPRPASPPSDHVEAEKRAFGRKIKQKNKRAASERQKKKVQQHLRMKKKTDRKKNTGCRFSAEYQLLFNKEVKVPDLFFFFFNLCVCERCYISAEGSISFCGGGKILHTAILPFTSRTNLETEINDVNVFPLN